MAQAATETAANLNSSADRATIRIKLADLGVAPENPRAGEPADEGIPQLAQTIQAAGVLIPLLVRPGRGKKEKKFMALDGRRRELAMRYNVEQGHITEDYEFSAIVVEDLVGQVSAAVLPNSERAPLHVADVIGAIGKFLKAKLDYNQIAGALGYEKIEIQRLAKLSQLPQTALAALKAGHIKLRDARMLARLEDPEELKELSERAAEGMLQTWQLQQRLQQNITSDDSRLILVGLDRYQQAGGGFATDLFGEMPDVLLEPQKLDQLWEERVAPVVKALRDKGLEVFIGSGTPENFEHAGYTGVYNLASAHKPLAQAAQATLQDARGALEAVGDLTSADADAALIAYVEADLAYEASLRPFRTIGAVTLAPASTGIEIEVFLSPVSPAELEAKAAFEAEAPAPTSSSSRPSSYTPAVEIEVPTQTVDTEGVNHALHENYTDVATRGLMRALVDDPQVAFTALIAQLFSTIVLGRRQERDAVLRVSGTAYHRQGTDPIPALDGEVRERLEVRKAEFLASGKRPIPWINGMAHGEKMALLAELVAVTVDGRETHTYSIRPAARAEADELGTLLDLDITAYWTPDEAFLKSHPKKKLLALLETMGEEDDRAKTLKKEELVSFTAERCSVANWAPAALSWKAPAEEGETEDADTSEDQERLSADDTESAEEAEPGADRALANDADDTESVASEVAAAANTNEVIVAEAA